MNRQDDLEFVDGPLLVRRLTVGDLATSCWIIASAATSHAVIVDPGDEPDRLRDAVSDLRVDDIVVTHTHWDHVLAIPALVDSLGCGVIGHGADRPVWAGELAHLAEHGHFDAGTATAELLACGCALAPPQHADLWGGNMQPISPSAQIDVADITIDVLHTPGHTPGGISLAVGRHVFTGDTLFPGGPGLTGWPFSDFATIIGSIEHTIFDLDDHMAVHPGHGASTTIGTERPQLADWKQRGW